MKRCLTKAVMNSQRVNQSEAREIIIDAATCYHDRLQRGEHVSLAWEMEVDLEIEVDTELMNAMSDLVHEIRTERDEAVEILKRWSETYQIGMKDMAELAEFSFNEAARLDNVFADELYNDIKHLHVDTFKNI